MTAGYDAKHDPRTPILSPEEKKVFVDTFTKTGFTGGINCTATCRAIGSVLRISIIRSGVPSLMIMAENDQVPPPSGRRHGEADPDLEKYLAQRPLDAGKPEESVPR